MGRTIHSRRLATLMLSFWMIGAWPRSAPAVVTYTNEANFIAAVGAHDLETFESVPLGDYGTSATFGNLTFSSPPSSLIGIRTVGSFGAHNTTPAGTRFLEATDAPATHDPMDMGHLGGALRAWGANFTDLDFGTISFLVDGVTQYAPAPGPDANTLFVGFIADAGDSFDFVTVRLTVNDNTYGIDDVRTALVPEPGTLSLLLFGGALGFRRSRVR